MELEVNSSRSTPDISSKLRDLFSSKNTGRTNKSELRAEGIALKQVEAMEEISGMSGDESLQPQLHAHSPSFSMRGNTEENEIASESTADRMSRMNSYTNLQEIIASDNLARLSGVSDQARVGGIQDNIELKKCIDKLNTEFETLTKTHSTQINKMKEDFMEKQKEMQKCKDEELEREKYLVSLEQTQEELRTKNQFLSTFHNEDRINKQIETLSSLNSEKLSLVSQLEKTGYSSSEILGIISASSTDLKKRLNDVESEIIAVKKKGCLIPNIHQSLEYLSKTLKQHKAHEDSLLSEVEKLVESIRLKKFQLSSLSNNFKRISENDSFSQSEVFLSKDSQEASKRRKCCSDKYADMKYQSQKSSAFYLKFLIFFVVLTLSLLAFAKSLP